MATPLVETPTFDAQVIVPEDGIDDESAASLVPPFQSLADRTTYLKTTYDAQIGKHRVAAPICSSSGIKAIPYYVEHVYPGGFGSPVTSGVIWQVGTPPDGDADRQWVMTLANPAGTVITVKDASGATLSTINKAAGGTSHSVTIAYDGSAWSVIDFGWFYTP